MKGFCERKFRSMFISGTFTKAVMYIMLLCDSIIAGYFIGETGVAALLIALGTKTITSPQEAGKLIPVKSVYRPDSNNKAVYDRNYQVFCKLYKSNAKHFKALNRI